MSSFEEREKHRVEQTQNPHEQPPEPEPESGWSVGQSASRSHNERETAHDETRLALTSCD